MAETQVNTNQVEYKVFSADATGVSDTLTTFTDWTTELIKHSIYTHSTSTSPEQVTVGEDGSYYIVADTATQVSSGTARSTSLVKLQIDYGSGFTDPTHGSVRAYMYNRQAGSGDDSCTISIVLPLSAGDKIRVESSLYSGTDTLLLRGSGCRLTIMKVG